VTANPGGQTITVNGSTLTATFTNLIDRAYYRFTVVATNSVGDSATSTPSSAFKPAAVLGAPTNVTATGGNTQAEVTWAAPASNGGSIITAYKVTAIPGGQTIRVNGSTLTAIFTGLTNGASYTFIVVATNSVGESAQSTPSNVVKPAAVPGAPTNVYAIAGNAQATVSWSAPASNEGSEITAYTVTANPGGQTITVNGSTLTATFTNLIDRAYYRFTVVATNSVGESAQSTQSNIVKPAAVLGAPTNVYAIAGNAQATVSWSAPAFNGGSEITGYKVTASPGGQTITVNGSTLTATFTGLTEGTFYIFIVTTINAAGTGVLSSASNPVTTATVPGVPTNVTAAAGYTEVMVFWSAPASTGGAAITSYKVTANPGGQTVTVGGSTIIVTFTGLTYGTSYTFIVVAINSVGESAPSLASNFVTPDLI
jgi:hypothetical protein